MLLSNPPPASSLQGAEKSPRALLSSPHPRVSSRNSAKAAAKAHGRHLRSLTAAESGATTSGPTETVATRQPADLDKATQLRLHFSTANLPHPDKSDYGGEDAYFTSPVGGGAFGVADGVGGWQDSGINPAEYSRTFMRLACAHLEGRTVRPVSAEELTTVGGGGGRGLAVTPADASLRDEPPAESAGQADSMDLLTPQGALAAAHAGTRLPGSTTACVMRLNRSTNCLSAANLGDSGFLLIRNGEAVFRSPALQHFFDCPLQFAAFPDYTSATDMPEDAGLYELPLQPGDVIVAGTDGLWDNVHQDEIVEAVPTDLRRLPEAAQSLVQLASKHAHDKKYSSPYSQEAVKQGIDIPWILRLATASYSGGKFRLGHLKGGKVDDITVIVAFAEVEERRNLNGESRDSQPQTSSQGGGNAKTVE